MLTFMIHFGSFRLAFLALPGMLCKHSPLCSQGWSMTLPSARFQLQVFFPRTASNLGKAERLQNYGRDSFLTDSFFDLFCVNFELCLPLCLRGSCIGLWGLILPRLVTMRCSLLPLPGTSLATTSVFALRSRTCSTDGICRPRKVNATVMMMHLALLKDMNMMHLTAKRTRLCRQKYICCCRNHSWSVCTSILGKTLIGIFNR